MTSFDAYLKNTASVAIAGHVRPDGDCVGSCLAVYNYIHDNYPKLVLDVYLEPIPDKFRFLKNSEVIQNAVEADETKIYDLFIALDCGDCGRLGAAAGLFEKAKKTVCVDHHISNLAFADENYIVPDASSTCELVYGLMDFDKITKEIAECIYLGIAHDTGVFQYSCTSSKTMQIAGALMDKGINYSKIVDETYYIKSYNQNRIWGKALMDSELYLDGRCIFSMIKKEDMQAYGVTPKDLDGIVSHLRSTIGVEVSIFLYQNEDDTYKISLRSASYVDVAKIAVTYGGGGHCRAAGASTNEEPKQILESLLAQIEEQLKENEGASCITES